MLAGRWVAWLLVAALVVGGSVTGCAGRAKEEPAPASQAPVLELKYHDFTPPGGKGEQLTQDMVKSVDESTQHRIKIVPYMGSTLIRNPMDTYKGVATGIADLALYMIGMTPGMHPLNEFFYLPLPGLPDDFAQINEIFRTLLQEVPALQEELENTGARWLSIVTNTPFHVHMVKAPVRTPADLKGKKVIVWGGTTPAEIVKAAGGTPVFLNPPDWYTSLERGLAEGVVTSWSLLHEYKLTELLHYHTIFPHGVFTVGVNGIIINLRSWQKVPDDLKPVLENAFKEWNNRSQRELALATEQEEEQLARAAGHSFIELTPEEVAQWKKLGAPVIEGWIKNLEAKGLPARQVYEKFLEIRDRYR